MRTKSEIIAQLTNPGIIAIIRAKKATHALPIAGALLDGGVIAIEITMSTPDAIAAIRTVTDKLGANALIGVGTVLEAETCRAAISAGAQFVVSPICRLALVQVAHAAHRPIILGAYTHTEAQLAHEAGADFVKLFPADSLGPPYIKALRAPLPHLRIVPTGGVDLNNIGEFLKAGCPAVGVGSSLITREILEKEDWATLTKRAAQFVEASAAR